MRMIKISKPISSQAAKAEGSETIERVDHKRGRSAQLLFSKDEDIVRSSWKREAADIICGVGVAILHELLKIPSDYGRSKGIAWYALLGFGLVHTSAMDSAANARILMWDSAA